MRRRGFSLAEVIMAAFIILIGFIAVAKMAPSTARAANANRDRILAVRVGRNVIEQVRSRPFPAASSTTIHDDLEKPVTFLRETVEGKATGLEFFVTDVNVNIPPGPPGYGNVTVRVEWRAAGGNTATNMTKSVVLTGGLTREP